MAAPLPPRPHRLTPQRARAITFVRPDDKIVVGIAAVDGDYMTWRYVRIGGLVIASALGVPASSSADSSGSERRDKALKGIEACLRRNEVSSKECKGLNKDVQTLVDVYRQGDKTVLPTLLRFTYLCDFFGEALIGDPEGFLSAVSHLSEREQQAVEAGVAGGMFGVAQPRFEAIRMTLTGVPDSSPNYQLARTCLVTLEMENASLLVNYFPPQTFTGRSGDFEVHWFSRELYALQEKPLWLLTSENERIYRITVLPAFSTPESATLTVSPDGTGNVRFRATDSRRQHLDADTTRAISAQQVVDFTVILNRIQYWQLPTELPQMGLDGAEWILEGVQDGRYHIVLRWCPGKTPFGEAGRGLFHLAGQKSRGVC
jgi:hypothetical protein